jgi:hypothetical protein
MNTAADEVSLYILCKRVGLTDVRDTDWRHEYHIGTLIC